MASLSSSVSFFLSFRFADGWHYRGVLVATHVLNETRTTHEVRPLSDNRSSTCMCLRVCVSVCTYACVFVFVCDRTVNI